MIRRASLAVVGLFAFALAHAYSPNAIVVTPSTFDFGWCPDNSKIDAQFTIRNTGSDLIPITGVQPTCGCTASQFTPGTLGSNDESKVLLTFNTRGYAKTSFNKNAKIKTDTSAAEYTVYLSGFVLDPSAMVAPEGDGIAGFEPGSKEKKKKLSIRNKSAKDVTLKIIQPAAAWANATFDATSIQAGQTASLTVAPSGSFDETRSTSMTVEATDGTNTSRFTVAIRTGTPPTPVRQPATSISGAPAPAPAKK